MMIKERETGEHMFENFYSVHLNEKTTKESYENAVLRYEKNPDSNGLTVSGFWPDVPCNTDSYIGTIVYDGNKWSLVTDVVTNVDVQNGTIFTKSNKSYSKPEILKNTQTMYGFSQSLDIEYAAFVNEPFVISSQGLYKMLKPWSYKDVLETVRNYAESWIKLANKNPDKVSNFEISLQNMKNKELQEERNDFE